MGYSVDANGNASYQCWPPILGKDGDTKSPEARFMNPGLSGGFEGKRPNLLSCLPASTHLPAEEADEIRRVTSAHRVLGHGWVKGMDEQFTATLPLSLCLCLSLTHSHTHVLSLSLSLDTGTKNTASPPDEQPYNETIESKNPRTIWSEETERGATGR